MTEEQLKNHIAFRTIDVPCCGNCKWFEREWEGTKCCHPMNQWKYEEPEYSYLNNEIRFNKEIDVCNRFEKKEPMPETVLEWARRNIGGETK